MEVPVSRPYRWGQRMQREVAPELMVSLHVVSFVRVPPLRLSPGGPQRHDRAPLPRLLSLFPCQSMLLVLSCLGLLAVAAAAEAPLPISPSSCRDPDKSLTKATVMLPMDEHPTPFSSQPLGVWTSGPQRTLFSNFPCAQRHSPHLPLAGM